MTAESAMTAPSGPARDAESPAFLARGGVSLDGRPANRLMCVLRTNGCSWDRGKKGCTMCDFLAHAIDPAVLRVRGPALLRQLEAALAAPEARPPVEQV